MGALSYAEILGFEQASYNIISNHPTISLNKFNFQLKRRGCLSLINRFKLGPELFQASDRFFNPFTSLFGFIHATGANR
jgi:hypothetical protein